MKRKEKAGGKGRESEARQDSGDKNYILFHTGSMELLKNQRNGGERFMFCFVDVAKKPKSGILVFLYFYLKFQGCSDALLQL